MNFDYIKEAEPSTDDLRQLYDSLYQNLEKAEELYWTKPQRCGMMLRKATEKICRIYNGYYEINFPESATLEEYLCYTGDDDHNAMVSRLSCKKLVIFICITPDIKNGHARNFHACPLYVFFRASLVERGMALTFSAAFRFQSAAPAAPDSWRASPSDRLRPSRALSRRTLHSRACFQTSQSA